MANAPTFLLCNTPVHAEYIEDQLHVMKTGACFSRPIRAPLLSVTFMCLPWDRYGQKLMTNLQRLLNLQNANDLFVHTLCVSKYQCVTANKALHNSHWRQNQNQDLFCFMCSTEIAACFAECVRTPHNMCWDGV